MPRKRNVKPSPWIKQKDEDLRIHDATPEDVAQAIMKGGAKPRPETKRPITKRSKNARR